MRDITKIRGQKLAFFLGLLLQSFVGFLPSRAFAAPFEDVHRRFHVNLPAGWAFAPAPGQSNGATFRNTADGTFALASINVMRFERPVTLGAFAQSIADAFANEPGYRKVLDEPARIDGQPGLHRRFVTLINGDPHLPKMIDERLLVSGEWGYVLQIEALADAFANFESSATQLMDSFAIGPLVPARREHVQVTRSQLVGHWNADDKAYALSLSQGGAATLNDKHGTWRFEMGSLRLQFGDSVTLYQVQKEDKTLVLTGGAWPNGLRLVRRHK